MDQSNQDNQQFNLQQLLEQFVDEVVAELPIQDFNDEQRAMVRELVTNRVDKRLMTLIIQELPEEKFQEILGRVGSEDLTDEQEAEVMGEAVDEIPDFLEKMVEALKTLREELTTDAFELKESTESNPPSLDQNSL